MLQLTNMTKSFPGRCEPVLKNINLTLKQDDFCMLIGANGSGKSTLMQIILETNQGKNMASVVQDVNKGTIPEMTLLENMVLSMGRNKKAKFVFYNDHKKEILRQIKEIQGAGTDFLSYINKPLNTLSGGQRQMIAILMAIHSKPQILLLDEHMSALDLKMQKFLMAYTTALIEKYKITTLMITHNLEDAILYGNRLIVLYKGQIVFDISGEKKTALTVSELLFLMVGGTNGD